MAARKWSANELGLLGKRPDGDIVRRFGRSRQAVASKRWLLGIPRFVGKGEPRPWFRREVRLLGADLDIKIARRSLRTSVSVMKHRQFLKIPPPWPIC